ncbi:MAG: photosystem II complex extrinsic protein PsbU [Cyanobacteria bacterium J06626_23]
MSIKRSGYWISAVCLILLMVGTFLTWTQPAAASPETIELCASAEQKIDLNNANLIAFLDCPGFYPNLATKIVKEGPYASVEDVLTLPGLSNQQRDRLKANLDSFMVSEGVVPLEMRMPPKPAFRK